MTTTIQLTPTQTLTVVRSDADALELEAVYGAASPAPPPHLHPQQDEHFEILEGIMHARIGDGDEQVLATGDTIDIPRGTVHQMWNAEEVPARVRWVTTPGGRTQSWFAQLASVIAGAEGAPSFEALLEEYADTFRLVLPDAPE